MADALEERRQQRRCGEVLSLQDDLGDLLKGANQTAGIVQDWVLGCKHALEDLSCEKVAPLT